MVNSTHGQHGTCKSAGPPYSVERLDVSVHLNLTDYASVQSRQPQISGAAFSDWKALSKAGKRGHKARAARCRSA